MGRKIRTSSDPSRDRFCYYDGAYRELGHPITCIYFL